MWEQVEKLLRTYLDGTLSLDTLEKLIREMRHMLPEEKERRASQIMELINAGMTEEEILEHMWK